MHCRFLQASLLLHGPQAHSHHACWQSRDTCTHPSYTGLITKVPLCLTRRLCPVGLATAGLDNLCTVAKSVQGTRAGRCVGVAQSGGGQAKRATPCCSAEGHSHDGLHLALRFPLSRCRLLTHALLFLWGQTALSL